MTKQTEYAAALSIFIFGLIIGISIGSSNTDVISSNLVGSNFADLEVSSNDHIRGERDAKIFIVEYSDYECPFCARFHPTVQRVIDERRGEVAWVYRHFPLESIHTSARYASVIGECIAKNLGEDEFWSYSDDLLGGVAISDDLVNSVAIALGLSQTQIDSCGKDKELHDIVDRHIAQATLIGATGTPGGFIWNSENGSIQRISGAIEYKTLNEIIDSISK